MLIYWLLFGLSVAIFVVTAAKLLLELFFAVAVRKVPARREYHGSPFVSIHIAAHNEPPELVKNTLRALSTLNYDQFEVLILDNNTKDEHVWKPVQAYCKTLGPRFRFYHKEGMTGFKAGALNLLKTLMDSHAEFVAVVDADYVVDPEFVHAALDYFVDDHVAFVQFPQANMNTDATNAGLALEYMHFFDLYLSMANAWRCVNATGTLTVYRVSALKQVGFFDPDVITEDADMGLRILAMPSHDGVYAPQVVGRGLMPDELESYKKQKGRWARGNASVLQKHFIEIFLGRQLSWTQKLGMVSQLTAWLNYTLVPIVLILLFCSIWALGLGPVHGFDLLIVQISAATLVIHIVLTFLVFAAVYARRAPARDWVRAFLVHLGTNWVYATSFLRAWMEDRPIFERTNKFVRRRASLALRAMASEFFLACYALVVALVLVVRGTGFSTIYPLLLVAVLCLCVIEVRRETAATREMTIKLMKNLREEFDR